MQLLKAHQSEIPNNEKGIHKPTLHTEYTLSQSYRKSIRVNESNEWG